MIFLPFEKKRQTDGRVVQNSTWVACLFLRLGDRNAAIPRDEQYKDDVQFVFLFVCFHLRGAKINQIIITIIASFHLVISVLMLLIEASPVIDRTYLGG